MNIFQAIHAILDEAQLSRSEIAKRLKVSEGILSQWSNDKVISEGHLAGLVCEAVEGPQARKESELLRLFLLLWQERIERGNHQGEKRERWSPSAQDLARRALEPALSLSTTKLSAVKSSRRTLCDFPDSFYPMAIICGDKREDSESRITAGDFGAVSASPAELRWLCELGLRNDVELYGDKIFMLESPDELKARFGTKNLLIVGSPGSNHLARRCQLVPPRPGWRPTAAPFRFNLSQHTLRNLEEFVDSVKELKRKQLVGKRAEESTELDMKNWLHQLFAGGILDPTNTKHWVRGFAYRSERDYGLITLARNPFCDPGESYVCIIVAGFHLFGTAHALRKLATDKLNNPQKTFERHPLGGVIKVLINPDVPFAKRFDESTSEWDDKDAGYNMDDLRNGLKQMQAQLAPTLNIGHDEINECLAFVESL